MTTEPQPGDNEAMLRRMMDTITTGILIVQSGKIKFANSALTSITGYSRDEIISMSLYELVGITDPVSQKYLLALRDSQLDTKDLANLEIGFRRKDGSQRWGQLTAASMDYGGSLALLVSVFDVTERHHADIALRDNEEKFRVLSEMISAAILIIQYGRILYANYAAERIVGYSREELMAMPKAEWTEIMDPKTRDFLLSVSTDQIFQMRELPILEVGFRRKDGSERWGEITLGIMEYSGKPAVLATVFDVTERKKTELALRESETKFREIFNNANDAIFLMELGDPAQSMKIVETNAVACKWTGRSHDELIQTEGMENILVADSYEEMEPKMGELFETGYTLFNGTIRNWAGNNVPVEMNAHLFAIGERKLIHCTARDITERKRVQKELENNVRFLQTLIDDIPAPVFYKDLNGVFIGCNIAYEKFLGKPRNKIVGTTSYDHYPRDLAQELYNLDLQLYEDLAIHTIEQRYVSGDGQVRHIITYKAPLINEHDRLTGVVGTILDITERKQYEQAVRESEEKFRSVVEQSSDGIVIVNEFGGIIEFNRAIERITGIDRRDAMRMSLWDMFYSLVPDEARVPRVYEELKCSITGLLLETGMIDPIVSPYMDIVSPDGSVKTIQAVIFPIVTSQGVLLGSIIRDVTERRRFETALEKERTDLKRSNEELEQFAYVASHDLQEPLRLITSYVKLIEKRYKGRLDTDADDYINYTVEAAARMQLIIKDLLLYSRVDRIGKPHEMISLESVYEKTVQNLALMIRESGATVTHTSLPFVVADGIQLMQVLQNLLSNAIKYRSEKPPEVAVSAERQGDEWIISVKDNGIGIDPRYFHKLFIIFQRLHSRSEYQGNGIGLAMCKKIVETHGGRIWVESKPGEGSTFKFTLPAADQRSDPVEDRGVV